MVILKVSREIAVAWKTEYYLRPTSLLLLIGPQVFDDVEQLCNFRQLLSFFFVFWFQLSVFLFGWFQ